MQIAAVALSVALFFGGGGDTPREISRDEVEVPILYLHHIDEDVSESTVISPQKFDELSAFLKERGYETIGFAQLIAYVDGEALLPQKPVLLTFDDGYSSNLTHAAPLLRERGQRATIFVIGSSVGKDRHEKSGVSILPHFSWEEVLPWRDVIELGSHTYDMHQTPETDGPNYRVGVLPKPGESAAQHQKLFLADLRLSLQELRENWGEPLAFAYPYGKHNAETERMLKEEGMRVTLTTYPGPNVVRRGEPESLCLLHRLEITEELSLEELAEYLEGGKTATTGTVSY